MLSSPNDESPANVEAAVSDCVPACLPTFVLSMLHIWLHALVFVLSILHGIALCLYIS